MTQPRDAHGHFLPGPSQNPSGRPKMSTTITHEAVRLLENDVARKRKIAESWLNNAERDIRALETLLDRTEGKVAEKHQIESVIVHISQEYAQDVLKALNEKEIERESLLSLTGDDEKNG